MQRQQCPSPSSSTADKTSLSLLPALLQCTPC
jgi:hypothetical protein